MTLVKTVELRILAAAGDAQHKLDELAAKADDMESHAIHMRFRVDDQAGKAQLDALRAQADRLGFKDVSIKVRVDGAGRAIADLEAVRHEEEKVQRRSLLSRIGGLGTSLVAGAGNLPLVGGLAGAGNGLGLAAVLGGAAALLPEIAGLASGFAAAGAGLGAFGLVAKSTLTAVSAAAQKVQTAQDNYNVAIANGVKPAAALRAEHIAIGKAYAELTPQQITLSRAIAGAATSWQNFVAGNVGGVSQVMTKGIGLMPKVFQAMQPFLKPAEQALGGLIGKLGTGLSSPGFSQFTGSLSKISGPAITAIGQGIGNVATQFGKLLTVMSGKDVAHAINIGFGAVAGTIGLVTGAVKLLMSVWDGVSARFSSNIHGIAQAFDNVRHGLADSAHSWAHTFDGLRHGAAAAWGDVAGFFSSIPGKIKGFFSGAGSWLVSQGSALIHGLGHAASVGWSAVAGWFGSLPGKIKGFFSGAGSLLASAGTSIMHSLYNGLTGGWWGKIQSFIGSIGSWIKAHKGPIEADRLLLVPAGHAIMGGLMHGMDSQMPAFARQLAGITQTIHGSLGGRGYGGGGDTHVHIHVSGIMAGTEAGFATKVHQIMREYKRNGGNAPLGIG